MAIRKSGTRFLADFMLAGTRYRKQFATTEEAEAWASNLKLALSRGHLVDKDSKSFNPLSLQELFDRVLSTPADEGWKDTPNERTARNHCYQIENFFGAKTLIKSINKVKLDKFVLHCKDKGNAPATIKLKLATMSRAFSFAFERELIDKKPFFPRIPVNNERMVYFSEEEEVEILTYLEENGMDDFFDFFVWQIDTGMRPIESRYLHKRDIKKDPVLGPCAHLQKTKNGEPRTIPLTRRAMCAVRKHKESNDYPWAHWNKDRIRRAWDKVRDALGRSGDKDFIFYVCRHTCGSRLIQRTNNLLLTKEWLGHKDIKQTLRYARLSPQSSIQGLNALECPSTGGDKKVTNIL
jgi:integrase